MSQALAMGEAAHRYITNLLAEAAPELTWVVPDIYPRHAPYGRELRAEDDFAAGTWGPVVLAAAATGVVAGLVAWIQLAGYLRTFVTALRPQLPKLELSEGILFTLAVDAIVSETGETDLTWEPVVSDDARKTAWLPAQPLKRASRDEFTAYAFRTGSLVYVVEISLFGDIQRVYATYADPPYMPSQRAESLAQTGRFREAIAAYDRAVDLGLCDDRTFFGRGIALLAVGEADRAIASFSRALSVRPRDPTVLNDRAFARQRVGRLKQALADSSLALEIDPESPVLLSTKGVTLAYMGELEDALVLVDRALLLLPEEPGIHADRAEVLARLGDLDGALYEIDLALALRPGDFWFATIKKSLTQSLPQYS